MKILSLNCRNWNRDTDKSSPYFWKFRMQAMEKMIKDKGPDIICFQEMICPMGQYVPDNYKRVGVSVSHHIYVKKGLKGKNHNFSIHFESANVENMKIFCIHGKWTSEVTDDLCEDLKKNIPVGGVAIAIGDFNVEANELTKRGMPQTAREILNMEKIDTFHHFTKPEQHGEIDHALLWGVTPKSYEIIKNGYGVERISDHWPIMVTI